MEPGNRGTAPRPACCELAWASLGYAMPVTEPVRPWLWSAKGSPKG